MVRMTYQGIELSCTACGPSCVSVGPTVFNLFSNHERLRSGDADAVLPLGCSGSWTGQQNETTPAALEVVFHNQELAVMFSCQLLIHRWSLSSELEPCTELALAWDLGTGR